MYVAAFAVAKGNTNRNVIQTISSFNDPAEEKKIKSSNNLPTYSRKEVGEHYNKENRVWVTFEDGVYDITDFIESHPGGTKKIMMAARN